MTNIPFSYDQAHKFTRLHLKKIFYDNFTGPFPEERVPTPKPMYLTDKEEKNSIDPAEVRKQYSLDKKESKYSTPEPLYFCKRHESHVAFEEIQKVQEEHKRFKQTESPVKKVPVKEFTYQMPEVVYMKNNQKMELVEKPREIVDDDMMYMCNQDDVGDQESLFEAYICECCEEDSTSNESKRISAE